MKQRVVLSKYLRTCIYISNHILKKQQKLKMNSEEKVPLLLHLCSLILWDFADVRTLTSAKLISNLLQLHQLLTLLGFYLKSKV